MATVRIYKVAELLGTTSQEVLALLKRDHGIELKSASSTIEEVVARSFVERVARQRNVSLPGGDMFAESPAPAKGAARKSSPAARKPEPAKPSEPSSATTEKIFFMDRDPPKGSRALRGTGQVRNRTVGGTKSNPSDAQRNDLAATGG